MGVNLEGRGGLPHVYFAPAARSLNGKGSMGKNWTLWIKLGLILFAFSVLCLFITEGGTAENYISIATSALLALFLAPLIVLTRVRAQREDRENTNKLLCVSGLPIGLAETEANDRVSGDLFLKDCSPGNVAMCVGRFGGKVKILAKLRENCREDLLLRALEASKVDTGGIRRPIERRPARRENGRPRRRPPRARFWLRMR